MLKIVLNSSLVLHFQMTRGFQTLTFKRKKGLCQGDFLGIYQEAMLTEPKYTSKLHVLFQIVIPFNSNGNILC